MRYIYQGHFTDRSGNAIEDGRITIYNANTDNLSTVYSSSGASTAITNSFITSEADGSFKFWVDTDDYATTQKFKINLSKTDFTSKSYDDIIIFSTINNSSTGKIYFHGSAQGSTQMSSTGEATGFTQEGGGSSAKFVSSSSSFTGNFGTTKYTISDVIKTLKKHGLMAT